MQLAPTFHDPPYWLGNLAKEEGRLEEAAALLGKAAALSPEQGWLARKHGEALLAIGRRDEAAAALRRAVALDPRDGEARRLLEGLGAR
jgi:tetratricopeptide (TPR) repeat protein